MTVSPSTPASTRQLGALHVRHQRPVADVLVALAAPGTGRPPRPSPGRPGRHEGRGLDVGDPGVDERGDEGDAVGDAHRLLGLQPVARARRPGWRRCRAGPRTSALLHRGHAVAAVGELPAAGAGGARSGGPPRRAARSGARWRRSPAPTPGAGGRRRLRRRRSARRRTPSRSASSSMAAILLAKTALIAASGPITAIFAVGQGDRGVRVEGRARTWRRARRRTPCARRRTASARWPR